MEGGIIEDDGSLLADEYVFVRIHGRNADYMQERSHSCQHHAYPKYLVHLVLFAEFRFHFPSMP